MRIEMQGDMELLPERKASSILIVDDEEIIRELCKRTLKDYRLHEAENGEEALAVLRKHPVDLVLADVMMPVMSGLDLLQTIKESDPEQLVVIMTGYADKEVILRALKAEADDFIQKPINLLQLKTSISKALEKKSLRTQLMQLKQMDRIKADFLGLISHKLRTPTTSISLFIQNLASGAISPEDPEFDAAINAINEESNYLACLIEDLLYYSNIILRDEKLQFGNHDLKEIAIAVLATKREKATLKGVALHNILSGVWPIMKFDRHLITFSLSALLDNAIKFTPTGGQVTLSGELSDEDLRISISDNGPGIPAEELPKVFEKFYQIDPAHTGQVRGFGLGLYYARQFIQEHGGTLSLESTPGQGTTAIISLPRAPLSSDTPDP